VHKDSLGASLQEADQILLFEQGEMDWSLSSIAEQLGEKASVYQSIDDIVEVVSQQAQSGDEILVMSNGGFGGIHQRILTALTQR
jgi:UDP-N-acetylmuramate: L-alanyl-gamma-D-glutamyl-meso-diaminopimelate ligase